MYLVSQACQPEGVSESGPQVSEAMRLRSALAWAYEFIVYQYEQPYAFSGAVYYNGDAIDSARYDAETQFEVLEETDGSEAKLAIRAIAGRSSMDQSKFFRWIQRSSQSTSRSLISARPNALCFTPKTPRTII